MNYQEVLTRGAKVLWRQKALWLFGLLAAFGGGGSYGVVRFPSIRFFRYLRAPDFGRLRYKGFEAGAAKMAFPARLPFFGWHPNWGAILVFILIAIFFLLIAMLIAHSISMPAILLTAKEDFKTDGVPLSIGEIFNAAQPFFWRVMGFVLVLMAVAVVFVVIYSLFLLPFVFGAPRMLLFCALPWFFILILVFWLATPFVELSLLALVLEDLGIFASFSRGWELYKKRFWTWVLVTLLLSAVRFVVSLIAAIPLVIVGLVGGVALLLPVLNEGFTSRAAVTAGIGAFVLLSVLLVVAWIIGAALVIYTQGGWVSAYFQVTAEENAASEPLPEPAA